MQKRILTVVAVMCSIGFWAAQDARGQVAPMPAMPMAAPMVATPVVVAPIVATPVATTPSTVTSPGVISTPGVVITDPNAGAAGVVVDANGVLRQRTATDTTGRLVRERLAAARASLNPKVAAASKLRKVSLNRLEQAVKDQIAKGQSPTDEMRRLAGLTRIKYVFFDPDTKDIVLAGPAEGWIQSPLGHYVGIDSGRCVLDLEDLMVAMQAFPPGRKPTNLIGCSIDPTQEGLQRMQQFVAQIGPRATPNDTQAIVEGLRSSLGPQTIRVDGVPANTHFAFVLIEADYRMKLIGIGLEQPAVEMSSFVDLAQPASVAKNALQRWYFVPDYKCVRVAADDTAMELVGDGVKLVGENELIAGDGQRRATNTANRASQLFTQAFTAKFPQLAGKTPVFAQLRNIVDLSVAAAFIQQHNYYAKAGWQNLGSFAADGGFNVRTYNTPKQVANAVNSVWKGNTLMTPIGGGVEIKAEQALESPNLLNDDGDKVQKLRAALDLKKLPADKWWWD